LRRDGLDGLRRIIAIDSQAIKNNFVATRCRYHLTYAFSNLVVYNFFKDRWADRSIALYPQDLRHIPAPWQIFQPDAYSINDLVNLP
jgi:hypothetical protein